MSEYLFWEHEGRRFAYHTEAAYECPVGKMAAEVESVTGHVDQPIDEAADVLGMPVEKLAGLLRGHGCRERLRVAGRLTERCWRHGCKMSKRGFRAFIDEAVPEREWKDDPHVASTIAINRRLGDPDWVPRRVVEQRYCDTKKEAKTWAYEQFKEARDARTAA